MFSREMLQAAPAKINLALHVVGQRKDGYHELESLMVFAEIGDELRAVPAENDSLAITGPFGTGLTAGPNNLVLRAVAGFRERWPSIAPGPMAFTLAKNLPVAAGLGGGSADAAAALRLLRDASSGEVPLDGLLDLAAQIGADVPACLVSAPLLARGAGEILEPLQSFPKASVVLVNPLIEVPTGEVFRKLLSRDNPPLPALPEAMDRPVQLALWLTETRNDLQPPAMELVPQIGAITERIAGSPGCMLARMSGSGATVFGVFGSSAQAHQAAHELRALWPDYWVAAAPLIQPEA
ncbi:4-diphosphocytidyl-2-C-methyl-D-erythritol kinase [Devosia pacifica]|uniref:4-diphosphocytidyl-2-C-methyl-D-erythritol kinase n=1 Tax=Devosia pacifica TaxID=1335967 RepID=A0A918S9W7_9HYPH|nr:4-(cytidine 5'-diphospho)-2-C-methyl-D-erythritol kinase [Devosia pacifica]GHA30395.1 4-diphosphocytidyl-2-C-methyl-D-erythritol kinase [Devosia pacifica]